MGSSRASRKVKKLRSDDGIGMEEAMLKTCLNRKRQNEKSIGARSQEITDNV